MSHSEITILFDEPFWIALFERYENGQYNVAREIIGTSEPTGAELKFFFDRFNTDELRFAAATLVDTKLIKKSGYKLQMRKVKQATQASEQKHVFTKAQGLLKMQMKESKIEHKRLSREETETMQQLKFELRQQKKKQKHKGH